MAMDPTGPLEFSRSLHADDRWLRDLARRMLRDTSLAEDAAQATWLAVMRSPPRGGMSRGFLATALRNVIAKLRRTDTRREARERRVATYERCELDQVVEKMEMRRVLLDAVLELDSPYRDVVLLRFHSDLPPAVIAERLAVPVATVKTRLRRAEELLAQRLDRRANGDRTRYLGALVATADPSLRGAITTLLLGGTMMASKNKIGLALAAGLMLCGGLVLFDRGGDVATADDATDSDAPQAVEPSAPAIADDDAEVAATDRTAVASKAEASGPPGPNGTLDDTRIVEGFVCDVEGNMLGGASVAFVRTARQGSSEASVREPEVVADARGRFSLTIPRDAAGTVIGAASGVATVYQGTIVPRSQTVPPVVVLSHGVALAGEVVDVDGKRIGNVEISVYTPDELKTKIPLPLENARNDSVRVRADDEGFFAFEGNQPSFEGVKLTAVAPGYLVHSQPMPTADERGLRIVLEKPAPFAANRVRGQVIDLHGNPVANADVILGHSATLTDERGLFDLDAKRASTAQVIRAVARGYQPGSAPWPADPPSDSITIRLGAPAQSIRGFVRNASGEPVRGATVQPSGGTPLGFVADTGILMYAEERIGGYAQGVDTDAFGAFELGGLEDRSYPVRVFIAATGASFVTKPIAAGSVGITIELPTDLTIPKLAGRVVDRAGLPIQDVTVSIEATRWHCEYLGGGFNSTTGSIGATKSDRDGRFTLTAVPRTDAEIDVDGDGIVAKAVRIPEDPTRELVITVDRKRFLRVDLAAGDSAVHFAVVDDEEQQLLMRQEEDGGVSISRRMELANGKSQVTIVPDSARFVILTAADGTTRRVAIEFAAGGVTVIR